MVKIPEQISDDTKGAKQEQDADMADVPPEGLTEEESYDFIEIQFKSWKMLQKV